MPDLFEPEPIETDEPLARFSFSSNDIRSSDNSVKARLFKPVLNNDRFELSVFRVSNMETFETHGLGKEIGRNRPTYRGYATLEVNAVLKCGLELDPDNTPPRHASIVGWPSKDSVMLKAQELADDSVFKAADS